MTVHSSPAAYSLMDTDPLDTDPLDTDPLNTAFRRIDECALEPTTDVKKVVGCAAASLGFSVGVQAPSTGRLVVDPNGSVDTTDTAEIGRRYLGSEISVWIASIDAPAVDANQTDIERIVAHLATVVLVAEARWEPRGASADVRLLVSPDASDQERASALRRLGLGSTGVLTALALFGDSAGVDEVVRQIRATGSGAHHALIDRVHIVIATSFDSVDELVVPIGLRGGISRPTSPSGLAEAWRHSVNALRFAIPSVRSDKPPEGGTSVIVPSSRLGAYEILAEQLTARELASNPDVVRLEELCKQVGSDIIPTLLAVASHDSLRKAARVVHMHHNSVGHRVERAEKILGFSCTEPYGRSRLLLTLTLHRLLASHALF
ncbi:helix-turn-helix domain-containing protein [Rhodococcoides yunnanense]|uniref:helix-turn-helix domain-containing protein n=1 Tax=Rhodococcoides yunnanense TaxID=278209 RepID=UPI00147489C2|nr:helix-turn-helix domain-containing protein [Rhodococcus yunnanensis]